MSDDLAWRVITITAPIIAITFAAMGWFMRDVFEASSRELPFVAGVPRQSGTPKVDRRVLALILIGAVLVIVIATLDLIVAMRHTEVGALPLLDSRRLLFTVVMGGPILGAVWIISLLIPMLRQASDEAWAALRRDDTITLSRQGDSEIRPDSRFQPNRAQIDLWRSGYSKVKAEQDAWQLGPRFLAAKENQLALGSFVHEAIRQLEIEGERAFESTEYDEIYATVAVYLDTELANKDASLARRPQRINELVRASLYLYQQMTNRRSGG